MACEVLGSIQVGIDRQVPFGGRLYKTDFLRSYCDGRVEHLLKLIRQGEAFLRRSTRRFWVLHNREGGS